MSKNPAYILVLATMLIGLSNSTLDQDRAECADQLAGLATCLPYVGGDSKAPTIDCCSGLKQVLDKSKRCLCVLIKDRDDPKLGLKLNATLALGLPMACHAPNNITECVDLLHLQPNSTEAKIFMEATNTTSGSSTSPVSSANLKGNTTSSGSDADIKRSAWRMSTWVGLDLICGVLVWTFTSNFIVDFRV